jgi:hypothetical protein
MKRLLRVAFFLAAGLFTAASAHAATYYIDFAGGSDSNNGTSTSTPWKHAPGMIGCTSICASTAPRPGDRFILKGGVTWPNSTMRWLWQWNGTSASRIYIGNDGTFGTGRPILDLGGAVATNRNVALDVQGNYVTVDNIDWKGLKPSTGNFGEDLFVKVNTQIFPVISRNYFHGWSENGANDSGTAISFATQYPALNTGGIVEYNIVDGSDTPSVLADPNCTGSCLGSIAGIFGSAPIVRFNVFRYVSNGMVGAFDDVHDNLFEFIRDSLSPTAHENAFENNRTCNAKFYNNTVRHIKAGVTVFLAEEVNCTGFAFNNLIYDSTAGNVFNIDIPLPFPGCTPDSLGKCPGGRIEVYNNTIECGPDSNPSQVCTECQDGTASSLGYGYQFCIFRNNHFITNNTKIFKTCTFNCTATSNITQTKVQANSQGYTIANRFAPASGLGATLASGANLGSLNIPPLNSDFRGAPRPAVGNWDRGAYQAPAPPSNLRAN